MILDNLISNAIKYTEKDISASALNGLQKWYTICTTFCRRYRIWNRTRSTDTYLRALLPGKRRTSGFWNRYRPGLGKEFGKLHEGDIQVKVCPTSALHSTYAYWLKTPILKHYTEKICTPESKTSKKSTLKSWKSATQTEMRVLSFSGRRQCRYTRLHCRLIYRFI